MQYELFLRVFVQLDTDLMSNQTYAKGRKTLSVERIGSAEFEDLWISIGKKPHRPAMSGVFVPEFRRA